MLCSGRKRGIQALATDGMGVAVLTTASDGNGELVSHPRQGTLHSRADARALDPSDVVVHLDAVPAPSIKVSKLEDHGDLHRQTGGRHEADSSWYRHCKTRLSGASHRRGDR